ncbi:MAG TPA: type IV secretion system DotC family protein [Candidatus Bilophila faecipullorum]|uniref:Type IV secretion system DotC family protein n=1 Tax=Candidatus Bilophila faecipullorum TaxID=2838482 RepID=A0A9D1R003_9BACT|nr:type IV secretory system conjugative DNA transfer family protein [Bilophila wadsworthia]HIW77636.1 type IV secretion system DotC family protein [Candidatus Bilophila faecipullorum]
MKAPAILIPKKPLPDLNEPPIHMESYQKGFRDGFQDGFVAADLSTPGVVLCGSGLLALLIACIVVMRHASRVVTILCQRFQVDVSKKPASQKLAALLLPFLLCAALTGCAGKQDVVNPAPVSPDVVNAPAPADSADKGTSKFVPHDATYREDGAGQSLEVYLPANPASGPRKDDPAELAELLEMKGTGDKKQTAVQLMRPRAMREAARLVTFQTAMSWRYGQLVAETERYSAIMDTAFNFGPLMLTQGEALIMPPQITRAGASMRIEDGDTATAAKTTYELLEPARYIAVVPNWREFLMADDFPAPEQPNPAVLPKNAEERAIWRAAVREAWAQGLAEADQLYADNVSRMARSYRGVMLYHLLTAQHLMSRVTTASADLGTRQSDNGNKLNIGQKVYRITAPSAFTVSPPARTKGGKRQ